MTELMKQLLTLHTNLSRKQQQQHSTCNHVYSAKKQKNPLEFNLK